MRRNPRPESGVVLVQALLLMLVLMAAVAALSQRGIRLAEDSVQRRGELRALYAAEAGLAMARHALRRDPEFATAQVEVDGSDVRVTAQRRKDGTIAVTATARSFPRGRRGTPVQCVRRAAWPPLRRAPEIR